MARYYPVFTNNALRRMQKWSLGESSVLDVWYSGEEITFPGGGKGMVRKYVDHEIGLSYVRVEHTGEYLITSVWQRARR